MSNENTSYEYFKMVRETAKDVLRREAEGEDRFDALHEEVDGSAWIIYTAQARAVLLHSSNDDAIFDEQGHDALSGVESMSDVYTRAAYYALCADVTDEVDRNEDELKDELRGEGVKFDEDEDEDEDDASEATA